MQRKDAPRRFIYETAKEENAMKALTKTALLTVAAGLAASSVAASAADDISVLVNGSPLEFDVPPIIENERTLVPMRAIFEALGAEVSWDGDTATVTAKKDGDTLSIIIGSNILYKNGRATELDVPAKIVDERTLVPLRAVAESFDANVDWDGETQSVLITAAAHELLPLDSLSDADMAHLKSWSDLIRYHFEKFALPEYVLSGEKDLYALMTEDKRDELRNELYNAWRKNAAEFILNIQIASDAEYELSTSLETSNPDLLAGYDKILKAAGLDAEAMLDGVDVSEAKFGIRTAVLSFKSADKMADCKYIGITASKGKIRYFTAENDILNEDMWYFCEVTKDYRGTISGFKKTDADTDLKSFAGLCHKAFNENLQSTVRSSKYPVGGAEKSE